MQGTVTSHYVPMLVMTGIRNLPAPARFPLAGGSPPCGGGSQRAAGRR